MYIRAFIFCFFLPSTGLVAQDTLGIPDLLPYTYHFTIENDKMIGEGATFFEQECRSNQYILLGEYHGSMQLAKFTKALIPMFHNHGCRNILAEVGPITAQILKESASVAADTEKNLAEIVNQYKVLDWEPIPFFSCSEDADFLASIIENDWNLIGIDQEFIFSYKMLLARMHENLPRYRKLELNELYQNAYDSLTQYMIDDEKEVSNLAKTMPSSKVINEYIQKASYRNTGNKQIQDAIEATVEIYGNNAKRKYWDCNAGRIEYMKDNTKKAMDRYDFDLKNDKMFIKLGSVHTCRGISPLRQFEVGNMLSELADFYDQSSLHINSTNRFWEEDGEIVDGLSDPKSWDQKYKSFLQLGQRDKWTVIDLRPLKEQYFYHAKWVYEESIRDWFKKHDVILIPPVDQDCTSLITSKK